MGARWRISRIVWGVLFGCVGIASFYVAWVFDGYEKKTMTRPEFIHGNVDAQSLLDRGVPEKAITAGLRARFGLGQDSDVLVASNAKEQLLKVEIGVYFESAKGHWVGIDPKLTLNMDGGSREYDGEVSDDSSWGSKVSLSRSTPRPRFKVAVPALRGTPSHAWVPAHASMYVTYPVVVVRGEQIGFENRSQRVAKHYRLFVLSDEECTMLDEIQLPTWQRVMSAIVPLFSFGSLILGVAAFVMFKMARV